MKSDEARLLVVVVLENGTKRFAGAFCEAKIRTRIKDKGADKK
jgi:hypothetical protein